MELVSDSVFPLRRRFFPRLTNRLADPFCRLLATNYLLPRLLLASGANVQMPLRVLPEFISGHPSPTGWPCGPLAPATVDKINVVRPYKALECVQIDWRKRVRTRESHISDEK